MTHSFNIGLNLSSDNLGILLCRYVSVDVTRRPSDLEIEKDQVASITENYPFVAECEPRDPGVFIFISAPVHRLSILPAKKIQLAWGIPLDRFQRVLRMLCSARFRETPGGRSTIVRRRLATEHKVFHEITLAGRCPAVELVADRESSTLLPCDCIHLHADPIISERS